MTYKGLFGFKFKPNSSEDGFVSYDKDVIKKSIITLIKTPKGGRIYEPDLGTNLNRLVFDLNLEKVKNVAKVEIEEVIKKYEPRVELLGIKTFVEGDLDDILIIFLNLKYKEFDDEEIMEIRLKKDKEWIEHVDVKGEKFSKSSDFGKAIANG